jgi:hypothetical protein
MEINYDLSKLMDKPKVSGKNNMILYCVETVHNLPYIYFLMVKNANDILQLPYCTNIEEYMKESFTSSTYDYKGVIEEKGENYVFYQVSLHETDFFPTLVSDVWWKVTAFEILYSGFVLQYQLDKKCVLFFQSNPEFLLIYSDKIRYEMPAIGYIGIGMSELNEQLLLENKNYRKGRFKKGYYFQSPEQAFKNALYDINRPYEYIIKLANHKYITDVLPIEDTKITIKNSKFYLEDIFLGDVPSHCKSSGDYELYYFDDDMIYLKTTDENSCTTPYYNKRDDMGCIMRYVLFLGNHWVGTRTKKGFDSFSYDEEFMVKHIDNFLCLSYHVVDKNIDVDRFKKDIVVQIK